ncbi:MAG: CaiB/BaiF CoA-transferase family protein, partial [Gemmatimonadota bacterium]|nr:CaiB/BaiF CoA-transferase family protein [Gemmatimonadota bacterium]
FATGTSPVPLGNAHPTIAPYETFRTAGGFINIAVGNDALWVKFCAAIERPGLAEQPAFKSNALRVENHGDLKPILAEIIGRKTTREWVGIFRAAGVPCGAINNLAGVAEDPQVKHREMIVDMAHPKCGQVTLTGIPIKLSETPGSLRYPPPLLGEHTGQVLEEWLGYREEQVEELKIKSVI